MFCSRKTNKSPVSGGKRLQMQGMASISTGLNKIKLRRLLRFQWTIDKLRKRGALFAGADRKKEKAMFYERKTALLLLLSERSLEIQTMDWMTNDLGQALRRRKGRKAT